MEIFIIFKIFQKNKNNISEIVFCSALIRAMESAEIIRNNLKCEVEVKKKIILQLKIPKNR